MEREIRREYMEMAMALAVKGEGWCHPNPMVGAVIVKDGRVIGEGYHARCGELHAERKAFASLTEPAQGADLYVTLEPCCHQGRQPPCTDAILENGIRRVIIGSRDPNPKVNGGGVRILREHGVEVVQDFMKEECDALNPVFFHYIQTGTPYVRMKYAMTADGKIATRTGASKWITGEEARARVQTMRAASMAIMAGIGTVLKDDPRLTCRIPGARTPLRIIADSRLRIPSDSQIVKTAADAATIVVCVPPETGADSRRDKPEEEDRIRRDGQETAEKLTDFIAKKRELEKAGVEVLELPPAEDGQVDLRLLMEILGKRRIDSLLLEGGGTLNYSALKAGIVQEADAFIAPKIFGGAGRSPVQGEGIAQVDQAWHMERIASEWIGEDLLIRYRINA